ncbi:MULTISPECIES: SRPBCC family protein [Janibacter]|uniref:Polyketide cyclase / dehydrase and lipid transport n=1 Tax=Janibacter indicus TaxID=857417 RepID=A0A1W2CV25_9MICO|nr:MULTISPECIES: SRPBCC family protein [Janibacter]QNF93706.1 SRPBCC family protein [Janibacter sp. YB324]SMC88578.1 Polyketide cyclase / dehydrase and lipid transport [Janibacter indicus]
MPGPRFVFHHEWVLDAPRDAVVAALADIEGYPRWWPQIRSLERIDQTSGRGRIRSALPLTLHLVLTREIEDREGGHLRVRLDGDLAGWAGWTIGSDPRGGTSAVFDQDVRVAARWSRAATLSPAVLRANHAWMMRQGRRGLAREITRRR